MTRSMLLFLFLVPCLGFSNVGRFQIDLALGTAEADADDDADADADADIDAVALALGKVAGWARQLGIDDAAGEAAAAQILDKPASAAQVLLDAAAAARTASDGVDREAQTVNHLLMMLFEERRAHFQGLLVKALPHVVVRTLAEDFDTIEGFKAMTEDHLSKMNLTNSRGSKYGLSGLVQYYLGLKSASKVGPSDRGKALIFTISYGGGHQTASSAVMEYLGGAGFSAESVDTTYDHEFEDAGMLKGAVWFNDFVLKEQRYAEFNLWDYSKLSHGLRYPPCPSPGCNTDRKHQFRSAVLKHRPDLLVTVYHIELLPILEIAKDLGNLPVIHIATDMDIKMHEVFAPGMYPVYPRFLGGVPFNIDRSWATASPLDRQHLFLSGYPVRSEFLEPFHPVKVAAGRAKLAPAGTKVLLMMTGGGGQDIPWPYKLAEYGIGEPLHIIVVAGSDTKVASSLREAMPGNVTFPDGRIVWQGQDSNVTVEVAIDPKNHNLEKPYLMTAEGIAFLMDASDAILTKPGGGSTAEVAYRGIPAMFDVSRTLLHWEQFTVDIFTDRSRGLGFHGERHLRPTIARAFALGRSTSLAEAPSGGIIHPGKRLARAAKMVLEAPCSNCRVLSTEAAVEGNLSVASESMHTP
mmetsp:Transcript_24660/g.82544  ORF Transcript_24660/g.82544 Transcript_24660/m.82544 type:complete len:636 (-) Transcript_24660:101-2008(-)